MNVFTNSNIYVLMFVYSRNKLDVLYLKMLTK